MKESKNVSKINRRRDWSDNCGICNHHFGSRWFRRTNADHSSLSRGQTNAHGSHPLGTNCKSLGERGSVTAEFAIVLPSVLLILVFALSAGGLQAQQVSLVELAAEGSRAIARGEESTLVQVLLDQAGKKDTIMEITHSELMVCVRLVQNAHIPLFGDVFGIPLAESQCARKSGL